MSIVSDLNLHLGNFFLEIPYWEISDQGVTVLKGASGSGKSSVIRALLGLEKCLNLSWILNGVDVAKKPVEERRLGVVFQNYELFPHMSAKENILFAAKARRIAHSEVDNFFSDTVALLLLNDCLQTKAQHLSGGESQRVALARALIGRPQFLFLDEPFSALDVELRSQARELVRKAVKKWNMPTLLVTHDQADIESLADHVVQIEKGRLKL